MPVMACSQHVRSSQAQLLPAEIATEQQSLLVVKKLLAIAVSGITYLRGIFPDRAYGSKYVEDQQVMILKWVHDCPGASQILEWMNGCFDAIEKKYLRTVIISIFTDPSNPQTVTEYYQFKIQYTAGGAHVDFESNNNEKVSTMSCGNTKKAVILLVRKLFILMQNLGPLPENVCLNMKLAYYDDVTPVDYQPPGFKEADGDTLEFEKDPIKLSMGEVATPFHCVKFDMATERHRIEQVEESVQAKEKWVMKIEEDHIITQSTDCKGVEERHKETTDLDETEFQKDCQETTEALKEMDTRVKKTSDVEVGPKRTRSGRIIKSTLVSQYDVQSSQESSATPTAKKKRKFSEPKEHY